MPTIRFSFQGYLTSEVSKAYHFESGKDIDVSAYTNEQLVEALKSGTIALDMSHAYDNSTDKSECEMFDYDEA